MSQIKMTDELQLRQLGVFCSQLWCILNCNIYQLIIYTITHFTVTPNLRSDYDRKMESLSNRRESVPLIVVVMGDRTSKISCNKVDGHAQNFRAAITSHRQVLNDRTTNRVWSNHQSCVIVYQAVARSVVRPVTSCPDWLCDCNG